MQQEPFKIYGNTYYVGTHGLGSVLITSPAGHVLIDGGLPESVPQIVAHIRSLGFRVEDVKLIVNSHVHFDHAGGIAELQKLSGARVAASTWTAAVMRTGVVPRDDPQFGVIIPIARVASVGTVKDGETLKAGGVTVTAHRTPGHTPGGTSWTWRSCEANRCLNLVYADSLTPVSADAFLFSRSKEYPHAVAGLRAKLLLSRPHPLRHPHHAAPRLLEPLGAPGATRHQSRRPDRPGRLPRSRPGRTRATREASRDGNRPIGSEAPMLRRS